MQLEIENWAELGKDLSNLVKIVPVSGPDGRQEPRKLEPLLENDILGFVVNFTHADRQVSDERTKMAFSFCKMVEDDWVALGFAIIDKFDDTDPLAIRERKLQIDEELAKLKSDIEKQWERVRLVEPATISLLQSYDQAFGTKYADPAKHLLLRVAFQFLHADGPPSQESQLVFNDYEKFLAKPGGTAEQPIQGKTQNELLESLLSDFLKLAKSVASKDPNFPDFRLDILVSGNIPRLVCAFMRADRHFSFERLKGAFYLKSGVHGVKMALADISETTVAPFQQELMKDRMAAPLQRPISIFILFQCFGTDYADQAINWFRRLATFFLNADGPPSNESQQVFNEYDGLLENALAVAQQVLRMVEPIGDPKRSLGEKMIEEFTSRPGTKSATTVSMSAAIPSESTPGLETLLAELNSLIGLGQVKQDVTKLANYIKFQKLRSAEGLKAAEISLHMVFHGNPGTGKTTVARLLSKIYNALGVVSKGHLVETDRSDLVAGYIGQTALKVKAVAEKSLGGILFIDEAYALKRGNDSQDFGNEAIETLLKFMEDNRHDLVVIAAGYPVEMNRFLDANPGLQSRFNKSLSFPDYLPEELMQIFLRLCSESDYKLSEAARVRLSNYFHVAYQNRDLKFGNARLVRNIFEKAVTNVANRVVQDSQADSSALELIEDSDIAAATASD